MKNVDEGGDSRFFDSIAARYDELITSDPRHGWVRGAFLSLVVETVGPGGLLLDFGCGTGTDARWYAERGYRVIAYDTSSAMIEELKVKCSAQIARGEILPYHGRHEAFLKQELRLRPNAVVSNFAVLSSITDLPRLFAAWAEQVAPEGYVVVSVLNPFFWEHMLRWSWWRTFVRSLRKGLIIWTSPNGPNTYLYFPKTLTAAASPHFVKLRHAGVGALTGGAKAHQPWSAPTTVAERLERRFWMTFPVRTFSQFTFVVFQKSASERFGRSSAPEPRPGRAKSVLQRDKRSHHSKSDLINRLWAGSARCPSQRLARDDLRARGPAAPVRARDRSSPAD